MQCCCPGDRGLVLETTQDRFRLVLVFSKIETKFPRPQIITDPEYLENTYKSCTPLVSRAAVVCGLGLNSPATSDQ